MAIFGLLEDVKRQISYFKKYNILIEYLSALYSKKYLEYLIKQEAPIRKELLDNEVYAVESVYDTKERKEILYESHRKYIDIQCIISGEEFIEVNYINRLLVTSPYNDEKDVILYDNKDHGSLLYMKSGIIAVLFPEDAHIPGVTVNIPNKVIKSVIKYSVNLV